MHSQSPCIPHAGAAAGRGMYYRAYKCHVLHWDVLRFRAVSWTNYSQYLETDPARREQPRILFLAVPQPQASQQVLATMEYLSRIRGRELRNILLPGAEAAAPTGMHIPAAGDVESAMRRTWTLGSRGILRWNTLPVSAE